MPKVNKSITYLLPAMTLCSFMVACNGNNTNEGTNSTRSVSSKLTTTSLNTVSNATTVLSDPLRRIAHVGARNSIEISNDNPSLHFVFSPDIAGNKSPSPILESGLSVYTFTPDEPFQYSTSYTVYLADSSNNIISAKYYFDVQPNYLVSFNHNSGFIANAGISGADSICMQSGATGMSGSHESAVFKALLGSTGTYSTARKICENNTLGDNCGVSNSANWVFQPNSDYRNFYEVRQWHQDSNGDNHYVYGYDSDFIKTTDSNGVLNFDLDKAIKPKKDGEVENVDGDFHYWSGFNKYWSVSPSVSTSPTDSYKNCNDWTGNASSLTGGIGYSDHTDGQAIAGITTVTYNNGSSTTTTTGPDSTLCSDNVSIVCVEQAPIALVQPANTTMTPLDTKIELQFPYEVESSTVTTNSIVIMDETIQSQIPESAFTVMEVSNQDGNTTASANTNFIFTLNVPLLASHIFSVTTNTSILDGVGLSVPSQKFWFNTVPATGPAETQTVTFLSSNRQLAHVGQTNNFLIYSATDIGDIEVFLPGNNYAESVTFSYVESNMYNVNVSYPSNAPFTYDSTYTMLIYDKNGNGDDALPIDMYHYHTQLLYTIKDTGNSYAINGGDGIPKADTWCNIGESRALQYRALLAADSPWKTRRICASAQDLASITYESLKESTYCGQSNSIDWPLQPNSVYHNVNNGTQIGTTDGYAVFNFEDSVLDDNLPIKANTIWTGLHKNWTTTIAYDRTQTQSQNPNDITCNGWSNSNNHAFLGYIGWTDHTDYKFISGQLWGCNEHHPVYCIEQPKLAWVQPLNDGVSGTAVIGSSIEVQFGIEVDPTTVTSNSFFLQDLTTGLNVPATITNYNNPDGTTTASSNTNFVLTPNNPSTLDPNHRYAVYVNNGSNFVKDYMGTAVDSSSLIITFTN